MNYKLLSLAQSIILVVVLVFVTIAGVNLQRRQTQLDKRLRDLENHAGTQDQVLCALSVSVTGQACGVQKQVVETIR